MTQRDPTRIPVIVGVGQVNDRPAAGEPGLDSAELMAAALAVADRDGGGGWLNRCDRLLVVPQLSFRGLDVAASLKRATGIDADPVGPPQAASGDTPVRLLNDAANLIGAGEATVCAIAGGEALRTAAVRAASAGGAGQDLFANSRRTASVFRQKYGLINPSEIYPLYENALRAELGQTLDEGQQETGLIWSAMSRVAADAEGAWLKTPRTPAEIVEPGANNRPIAFPYSKFMVANASVNQGAATIVSSLAAARAAGTDDSRLVYVGAGAAAHESDEPLTRDGWTTSPSMRVSIEGALSLNGLATADLDHVELYSCFPCVPKMARRVLGWPVDRPVTVHGGLTFGGGPIGNYMGHAIAAMTQRLRRDGRYGLLFANGGHCSHNHSIVLSRTPPSAVFPKDYDLQARADAGRSPIPPMTDTLEGSFPVESYTVVHGRGGEPAYGVVLSLASSGERVIARVEPDDARSIAALTDGTDEQVGRPGRNRRVGDLLIWTAV